MTPHQRRKGGKPAGTLVLEWERKPVGRIYRATGLTASATNAKTIGRLKAACETLFDQGRLDVLEAVRDGLVHPMTLLEAQRREALSRLPTAEHLARLEPLMSAWANATPNEHTRTNRLAVLRHLRRHAGATVGDLPGIVKATMAAMAATPAQANRIREQAMAFIRDRFSLTHPLHLALQGLSALETRPVRRRIHLSPADWRESLDKLGPARPAWFGLCLTGCNPKEFWGRWEIQGPGVYIHGTKARDRVRVVPLIAPIEHPTVSRDVLIWWLRKAGLYPYAARHSFSRWLEDSGIDPWRVRAYMGHRPANQTEEYQRGDMVRYLVPDAARMRELLGFPAEAAQLTRSG